MSDDKNIIFSYSAEDAVNDGTLIEIEQTFTRETGFKCPVRITKGVYQLINPSQAAITHGQSFEVRLKDVLTVALAAMQLKPERIAEFQVFFWESPEKQFQKKLWAAPDETSGPAINILLPEEY